jgi:organic radical activating enzyme
MAGMGNSVQMTTEPAPGLCALPFVHLNLLATGRASLCCISSDPLIDEDGAELTVRTHTLRQIWESKAYRDIRAKMLAGETVSHCRNCLKAEKKGFGSYRTEKTALFLAADQTGPTPIQITAADLAPLMPKPFYFDLRFDNLCNLKCVICNGSSSSRIENDPVHQAWTEEPAIVRTPNRFGSDKNWLQSDLFTEELKEIGSEARYIQMAGGEPFMSKIGMTWLAELCRSGRAADIVLKVYTNLTRLDHAVINMLSQFKEVQLTLSIDGVGAVYEWVRFPGKWDAIARNAAVLVEAQKTKLKNTSVHVNATMSIFGALSITEVFDFAKAHGFGAHLNNANWPHYASCRYMPEATKDKLEARLRGYAVNKRTFVSLGAEITQWMADIRTIDSSALVHRGAVRNVMRFANDMDASRGTDIRKACPEIVADLTAASHGWDEQHRFLSPRQRAISSKISSVKRWSRSYFRRVFANG